MIDTIAAVATPPGVSAVAIIRLSGPCAHDIAQRCFIGLRSAEPSPGAMRRGWICDPQTGERLDEALAVYFFGPHSFTGEDVVELHVHGGAGVVAACLTLVLRLGARLAAAGEFTKRAFLNGRIDLAQAEAVADLISAESERAAKAAVQRLAGGVGADLRDLRTALLERLVEIEAHVDYPDEVPEPDAQALAQCAQAQHERVKQLLQDSRGARVLRDGLVCVIAGPPNAGKSSLMNALVRTDRAIVSATPGTTRDVIEDRAIVDGVVLRLFDTAGLRASEDAIEAEGIARAARAIDDAELLITVIDGSEKLDANGASALQRTSHAPRIVVCNKLDLGTQGLREIRERFPDIAAGRNGATFIAGSVLQPRTQDEIRCAIARLGWGGIIDANQALIANARQIEALTRASRALEKVLEAVQRGHPVDVASAEIREAVSAYGEVTGDTVTEEVLDGIFSRFCVGK